MSADDDEGRDYETIIAEIILPSNPDDGAP